MKSYRPVESEATPEDLVNMACDNIEELAGEIEEWMSGMSGTNLENSEKYSMLGEAYDELSRVQRPEPDVWPHANAKVSYTIYLPKRKKRSPSRQMRADNAIGMIQALVEFYEGLDDLEDNVIVDELREIAEIHVELPGMFG